MEMKGFSSTVVFLSLIASIVACGTHSPGRGVPQTFIGTVGQGCTPGAIEDVFNFVADPTKCDLLFPRSCNLCNLRLYKPELTISKFFVQPLHEEFSTLDVHHVEAVNCKCSDGCFFHRSSMTQLGIEPLPVGNDGKKGSFSEPFACFSGSFTKDQKGNPAYSYLTWCENDGGCPNNIVARYIYLISFELFTLTRPRTKGAFKPQFATLPVSDCIRKRLPEGVHKFLQGDSKSVPEVTKPKVVFRKPVMKKRTQNVLGENKGMDGKRKHKTPSTGGSDDTKKIDGKGKDANFTGDGDKGKTRDDKKDMGRRKDSKKPGDKKANGEKTISAPHPDWSPVAWENAKAFRKCVNICMSL